MMTFSINQRASQDPSKTTLARKRYTAAFLSRFRKLRSEIWQSIVDKDAFGLQPGKLILQQATRARQFDFPSDASKVQAFMDWLHAQIDAGILEIIEKGPGGTITEHSHWQDVHIQSAYVRAVEQATALIAKVGVEVAAPAFGAFTMPVHAETLELLYTRSYELLKGTTEAMASRISQELAEGLSQGLGPREIARRLNNAVDGIGIARARVIAQTELIYAHNAAALRSYDAAGIQGVTVDVEWTITGGPNGDAKVCPLCKSLSGRVLTLAEAKKLHPPRHPRCRCVIRPSTKAIRQAEARRAQRKQAA